MTVTVHLRALKKSKKETCSWCRISELAATDSYFLNRGGTWGQLKVWCKDSASSVHRVGEGKQDGHCCDWSMKWIIQRLYTSVAAGSQTRMLKCCSTSFNLKTKKIEAVARTQFDMWVSDMVTWRASQVAVHSGENGKEWLPKLFSFAFMFVCISQKKKKPQTFKLLWKTQKKNSL